MDAGPVNGVHPKVAAAGLAGAVSVLLVAVFDAAGVSLGPEVASAVTTVLAFGAGYLKAP